MSRFGALYVMYMSTNSGRLPRSERDLRAFHSSLEPSRKAQLTASHGADLFVSSRDSKPLVVIYRDSSGALQDSTGAKILAYEAEGLDGYREMVNVYGSVERIEERELQQLLQAGGRVAGGP